MTEDPLDRLATLRQRAQQLAAQTDAAYADLHREVARVLDAGEATPTEIAAAIGANRVSVYRMADRGRLDS